MITTESVPTHEVRLYLSGPLGIAEQTCRKFCLKHTLCVTVNETKYIYNGGEELGVRIGIRNHPATQYNSQAAFEELATKLAHQLLADTQQLSVLMVDRVTTTWFKVAKPTK